MGVRATGTRRPWWALAVAVVAVGVVVFVWPRGTMGIGGIREVAWVRGDGLRVLFDPSPMGRAWGPGARPRRVARVFAMSPERPGELDPVAEGAFVRIFGGHAHVFGCVTYENAVELLDAGTGCDLASFPGLPAYRSRYALREGADGPEVVGLCHVEKGQPSCWALIHGLSPDDRWEPRRVLPQAARHGTVSPDGRIVFLGDSRRTIAIRGIDQGGSDADLPLPNGVRGRVTGVVWAGADRVTLAVTERPFEPFQAGEVTVDCVESGTGWRSPSGTWFARCDLRGRRSELVLRRGPADAGAVAASACYLHYVAVSPQPGGLHRMLSHEEMVEAYGQPTVGE